MNKENIIKQLARNLGFDSCGIARAGYLEEDARRLENWLTNGYHGTMQYMENHFQLRVNPQLLVPGAKSVITVLKNYYPRQFQRADAPVISKYAYGSDYHEIIRPRLNEFLHELRRQWGEVEGRGFVDSAPVLERSWAARSGLGWVGKNGNLLNRETGSFFFIACLVTDMDLSADDPVADYCGTCTRCIDACPTDAILPGKIIDGSKCISYYTIEYKPPAFPEGFSEDFANRLFGCDICQDVCPWNRFSRPHNDPAFDAYPEILEMDWTDWHNLDEEKFRALLRKSPIWRSRFKGIQRNLDYISGMKLKNG